MEMSASVQRLLEANDGSLPDINVGNLTSEQTVTIYEWLMSQCSIAREPTLWNVGLQQDVLISETPQPARAFVSGSVETFRHCLSGLSIHGIALPELSVSVEAGGLSFDYRMGPEWGKPQVEALFELLSQILELAPDARITRTEEGYHSVPSPEFSAALVEYALKRES